MVRKLVSIAILACAGSLIGCEAAKGAVSVKGRGIRSRGTAKLRGEGKTDKAAKLSTKNIKSKKGHASKASKKGDQQKKAATSKVTIEVTTAETNAMVVNQTATHDASNEGLPIHAKQTESGFTAHELFDILGNECHIENLPYVHGETRVVRVYCQGSPDAVECRIKPHALYHVLPSDYGTLKRDIDSARIVFSRPLNAIKPAVVDYLICPKYVNLEEVYGITRRPQCQYLRMQIYGVPDAHVALAGRQREGPKLLQLGFGEGRLLPEFSADVTKYTLYAFADKLAQGIECRAQPSSETATVTMNGVAITPDSTKLLLQDRSTIDITVEDFGEKGEYVVELKPLRVSEGLYVS